MNWAWNVASWPRSVVLACRTENRNLVVAAVCLYKGPWLLANQNDCEEKICRYEVRRFFTGFLPRTCRVWFVPNLPPRAAKLASASQCELLGSASRWARARWASTSTARGRSGWWKARRGIALKHDGGTRDCCNRSCSSPRMYSTKNPSCNSHREYRGGTPTKIAPGTRRIWRIGRFKGATSFCPSCWRRARRGSGIDAKAHRAAR